jgi:hypothetical protein
LFLRKRNAISPSGERWVLVNSTELCQALVSFRFMCVSRTGTLNR